MLGKMSLKKILILVTRFDFGKNVLVKSGNNIDFGSGILVKCSWLKMIVVK